MVDLHAHVLPGLDDGPETLAEAVEMLSDVVATGVTTVVATPHVSDRYPVTPDQIKEVKDKVGNRPLPFTPEELSQVP